MKITKLEFIVDDTNRIDLDQFAGKLSLAVYNKSASGQWYIRGGVLLTPDQIKSVIGLW